jgi:hypothetical protein
MHGHPGMTSIQRVPSDETLSSDVLHRVLGEGEDDLVRHLDQPIGVDADHIGEDAPLQVRPARRGVLSGGGHQSVDCEPHGGLS